MKSVAGISICIHVVYDIISQGAASDWLIVWSGTLRSPIGMSDCFDQRAWLNRWFWLHCFHSGRFRGRCLGEKVIAFLQAWLPKC